MKKHLKESLGLGKYKVPNGGTGHATNGTKVQQEDKRPGARALANGHSAAKEQNGLNNNGISMKKDHLDIQPERNGGTAREPLAQKQPAAGEAPAPVKPRTRKNDTKKKSPPKKRRVSVPVELPDGDEDSSDIEIETGPKTYETLTPEYGPGDLLWSKIGRSTFWPCMVIRNPVLNIYYQQKRDQMQYYVQYFGLQRKHGWTQNSGRVLPFNGLAKYDDLVKKKMKNVSRNVKARKKFYDLDIARSKADQTNWDRALQGVENAQMIEPPSRRYETLRLIFRDNEKKAQKPQKKKSGKSSGSRGSSSPFASSSSPSENSPDPQSQLLPFARTKASVRSSSPRSRSNGHGTL